MMRSFCFGFYFSVLLCFSHVRAQSGEGEEDDDSPTAFLNSLNGLKEVYLHNFGSEIQNSRSVLIYPAAVMQEFMLEHAMQMPEGSSSRAKVLEVMPFDTGLPFALDMSNFTRPLLKALAIKTFYSNRTPKMSATMDDPYYFSYRAFMKWSKVKRLEAAAGETATPFNPFVTVAAIRINSLQSTKMFTWIDHGIDFIVSERQTIQVPALRGVDFYDYAEFSYPRLSECTAGALRLKISDESSIIFIIARNVTNAQCNSSENLMQLLTDKAVETITFTPRRMFVSIPILHVSTIVWPERKLVELGLLSPKPNRSQNSDVFGDHYESASFIFNPSVPKDAPIPMISHLTPRFEVDRPFLVTVLQKENTVPVLVGLIQNPTAGFECCSPTEPQSISLTIQNKGQRPSGDQRRGTMRQFITTTMVPSITMHGARQNNKGSD